MKRALHWLWGEAEGEADPCQPAAVRQAVGEPGAQRCAPGRVRPAARPPLAPFNQAEAPARHQQDAAGPPRGLGVRQ